jgi:hypothetical protein
LFPYFPNAGASQNEIFFVSPDAEVLEALNLPDYPTRRLHKLDLPAPGAPKGITENAREDSIYLTLIMFL